MKHRESLHAFRHTFLQSLDPKARRALELFAEAMHEVDVLTGQGGYAEQFEASEIAAMIARTHMLGRGVAAAISSCTWGVASAYGKAPTTAAFVRSSTQWYGEGPLVT